MSRSKSGRRWLASGAACFLVVVAAEAGPSPGTHAASGRWGPLRTTLPMHSAALAAAAPAASQDTAGQDTAGGWRPKRPKLCGGAILLTVLVGGVMSTAPGGSVLAAGLMAPLIIEACG